MLLFLKALAFFWGLDLSYVWLQDLCSAIQVYIFLDHTWNSIVKHYNAICWKCISIVSNRFPRLAGICWFKYLVLPSEPLKTADVCGIDLTGTNNSTSGKRWELLNMSYQGGCFLFPCGIFYLIYWFEWKLMRVKYKKKRNNKPNADHYALSLQMDSVPLAMQRMKTFWIYFFSLWDFFSFSVKVQNIWWCGFEAAYLQGRYKVNQMWGSLFIRPGVMYVLQMAMVLL